MSYDQSIKDQFLSLRADGLTYAQCAQQLNVSKHTLINWAKESKPQLDALRAIHTEALLDQYHLRLEQRIVLLAGLYPRVCQTIEKTDLLSRGIGTLFTILLKLNTALDKYDLDPASLPLTARLAGRSDPSTPEIEQMSNPDLQKIEPDLNPPNNIQNSDPEPPTNPELTAANPKDPKTEPKLNHPQSSSPRTEHQALSTEHSLRQPTTDDLATEILILEHDIRSLLTEPQSTEIKALIREKRELLDLYRSELMLAAT